jgi:hypothetical protein
MAHEGIFVGLVKRITKNRRFKRWWKEKGTSFGNEDFLVAQIDTFVNKEINGKQNYNEDSKKREDELKTKEEINSASYRLVHFLVVFRGEERKSYLEKRIEKGDIVVLVFRIIPYTIKELSEASKVTLPFLIPSRGEGMVAIIVKKGKDKTKRLRKKEIGKEKIKGETDYYGGCSKRKGAIGGCTVEEETIEKEEDLAKKYNRAFNDALFVFLSVPVTLSVNDINSLPLSSSLASLNAPDTLKELDESNAMEVFKVSEVMCNAR